MIWDAFISHASEDKEAIARPLAMKLIKQGLRVWFDESSLVVGDSLRSSIDNGLRNSRFGIVILSPMFFQKDWPQKELDGLVALEQERGKVILPIWHEVAHSDVLRYSSILAGRLAVNSSRGLDYVVQQLLRAIPSTASQLAVDNSAERIFSVGVDVGRGHSRGRVKLIFDASDKTGKKCIFRHTDPATKVNAVYLRIAARNASNRHLQAVYADLVGLHFRHDSSASWMAISLEPHHLNWAFSHGKPCDSLEPNTIKYIDLVTFRDDLDGIDIMVARPRGERFYWQSLLNRVGHYLFDVRVFPEGCERTEKSFLLDWKGNIEKFKPTDLRKADDIRHTIKG